VKALHSLSFVEQTHRIIGGLDSTVSPVQKGALVSKKKRGGREKRENAAKPFSSLGGGKKGIRGGQDAELQ